MVIKIIEIIKKCECGCKFSYEKDDIVKENVERFRSIGFKMVPITIMEYSVKCPICKNNIWLWGEDLK